VIAFYRAAAGLSMKYFQVGAFFRHGAAAGVTGLRRTMLYRYVFSQFLSV
jgi:hypothetical protein